jgi:DDE superfamily endonuclease
MDNCRVHLVAGIREAIEKARATLRYLLKYAPDLNPIELPYGPIFRDGAFRIHPHSRSGADTPVPRSIPTRSNSAFREEASGSNESKGRNSDSTVDLLFNARLRPTLDGEPDRRRQRRAARAASIAGRPPAFVRGLGPALRRKRQWTAR